MHCASLNFLRPKNCREFQKENAACKAPLAHALGLHLWYLAILVIAQMTNPAKF